MAKESKEKKQPTIKTLEDKGTKIDYVDFGDGRQAFFYQTEKFRGVGVGAFKLGWTDKYTVISPTKLSRDTLVTMSANASAATGSSIKPEDFIVYASKAELRSSITVNGKAKVKKRKTKE